MTHRLLAALVATVLFAGCGGGYGAPPNPGPTQAPSGTPAMTVTILGSPGFATPNGFTLYEYSADAPNVSNCTGTCAQDWPPFQASAGAQATGSFTILARGDGTSQWVYKGHPLYTFIGDTAAGEASGDGFAVGNGTFHVARP